MPLNKFEIPSDPNSSPFSNKLQTVFSNEFSDSGSLFSPDDEAEAEGNDDAALMAR